MSIDIVFGDRFKLALLCMESEALGTLSNARPCALSHNSQFASGNPRTETFIQPFEKCHPFFNLPLELRELIYDFALPDRELGIRDVQRFSHFTFLTALGDPTGFSFPLGLEHGVLQVNRQIRREALPLAYRKTSFMVEEMDDAIRLLIAIGQIGRDNITSLGFHWRSRSEIANRWEKSPDGKDNDTKLPALHMLKCVELLRLCKRLGLTIFIERETLEALGPGAVGDPGLRALFTSKNLRSLEICDDRLVSLDQHELIGRLQETRGKREVERLSI